jgi:hypothetical protein
LLRVAIPRILTFESQLPLATTLFPRLCPPQVNDLLYIQVLRPFAPGSKIVHVIALRFGVRLVNLHARGRFLERAVDWNEDGKVSKKLDFDGNGLIENKKISLGTFQGNEVFGTETKGEAKILIPITNYSPAVLEPEYIAIAPDSSTAYVTLQEDDAVAVVDLSNEQVIRCYGLGISQHKTDKNNDGWVRFDQSIAALKEPDGITTTSDGRYFITADEGDTDSDSSANQIGSGGRSVSVFDAETGVILGDTGNQVDEFAFANHVYPDRRSDKKGSEPEMLVSFEVDEIPLVAVGMERAGVVELISLEDPIHPKVVALGKIAGDEDKSPEGIAHYVVDNEHYLLTANEMNGTVECFKVTNSLEGIDSTP